ncbi:MAG TPA: PAS domain-containing protein, partial [Thiobacillus sp.]
MRDEHTDPDIVRRIQNAIDMLPSPIFIKDAECRYIACNRAFESYIGLPRAKIVGATVHDVAPAELAAIYEKADRDLLADGGTQTYETNVRYADGSVHDVIFYKSVFYDAEGRPDGISGVILDITERKNMENALAQAAREDFLTGAVNLRTFYELADQEFARFKRTGEAFSLLVLDLDHFKKI